MMNKDNRNDKIRKIAKKGLTFSLCAVLAGGLAAGSFEGVNKLAGWSGATTVEAASNMVRQSTPSSHGHAVTSGQKRRKRVHPKIKVCTPKKNAKK